MLLTTETSLLLQMVVVMVFPEKYEARFLTTAQVENLQAAGINKVRYIDALLDDNNAATNGIAFVFGTGAAPTGDYLIDSIDIPQNYFDAPRSNTGNRGRGFAINTGGTASTIAATVQFAVWDGQTTGNDTGAEADGSGTAPTASYNNAKNRCSSRCSARSFRSFF